MSDLAQSKWVVQKAPFGVLRGQSTCSPTRKGECPRDISLLFSVYRLPSDKPKLHLKGEKIQNTANKIIITNQTSDIDHIKIVRYSTQKNKK